MQVLKVVLRPVKLISFQQKNKFAPFLEAPTQYFLWAVQNFLINTLTVVTHHCLKKGRVIDCFQKKRHFIMMIFIKV